jgi:hypothetical protein
MTIPTQAQVGLNKVGQSTMNFLQVSVSPKGSSMGEAYTAVGSGVEAIFYNPAALAESDDKFSAIFSTTQWLADITYITGAVAWNMGSVGSIGLSYLSVDYGDIYATSLLPTSTAAKDPLGYQDDGMMDNVGAYAIGLTYSRFINSQFMMGGSIRYLGQQLGKSVTFTGEKSNNMNKLAFDFGLKYYPGFKSFRFGMSIRNFGTAVQYEEISAQLPLIFAIGAAIDLMDFVDSGLSENNELILAVDFSHPNNYTERASVGVEYGFMNLISFRGGYQSNLDFGGLSAGFGLTPSLSGKKLEISYSFSKYDVFDNVNRFAFEISL